MIGYVNESNLYNFYTLLKLEKQQMILAKFIIEYEFKDNKAFYFMAKKELELIEKNIKLLKDHLFKEIM